MAETVQSQSQIDAVPRIQDPIGLESSIPALIDHGSDEVYVRSWRLALVTFSLSIGTFLVALDVNIIGVAVPEITSVFNSLDDVAWYASAYLLTVTALQPTMGFLYKSFNVRAVYFSNVLIFEG